MATPLLLVVPVQALPLPNPIFKTKANGPVTANEIVWPDMPWSVTREVSVALKVRVPARPPWRTMVEWVLIDVAALKTVTCSFALLLSDTARLLLPPEYAASHW